MGSEFATLLAIIADHTHELPLPFGQLILTVNIGASEGRMMFTVLQLKSYWPKSCRFENRHTVQRLVHQTGVCRSSTILLRGQHDGCQQPTRRAWGRLCEYTELNILSNILNRILAVVFHEYPRDTCIGRWQLAWVSLICAYTGTSHDEQDIFVSITHL